MKTLIIGAGAIGQCFAFHLQEGGDDVHLLVRPRQEAEARQGFVAYPMNRAAWVPSRLRTTVHIDQDVALAARPDRVVLAVSSVALRKGDWLQRLGEQLGDAVVLALQAGPEDRALVEAALGAERVAWGMLSVMSFQAPLPGGPEVEPGVAWWFPTGDRAKEGDRVCDDRMATM